MNDYNYRIKSLRNGRYECECLFGKHWLGVYFQRTNLEDAKKDCEKSAEVEGLYLNLQPILEYED